MPRNLRQPPPGYDVVKLPAVNRWTVLAIERDRAGRINALKPLLRPLPDGSRVIQLFATRARAVLEITLLAQEWELSELRKRSTG